MRAFWPRAALIAALSLGALAAPAAAAPADDFAAVVRDYVPDQDITACKFTRAQLVNARNQITPDMDSYAPDFRTEVNREIKRWDDGGCKSSSGAGGSTGASSQKLRVVKVQPRHGHKEYVTIKNVSKKTVNLRHYSLRDHAGHKIRFARKLKLKRGRKLRVISGCKKGHAKAFRKGSRYYACKKKLIWNDGGDVARIFTAGGTLVSQYGYKSFRSALRF